MEGYFQTGDLDHLRLRGLPCVCIRLLCRVVVTGLSHVKSMMARTKKMKRTQDFSTKKGVL